MSSMWLHCLCVCHVTASECPSGSCWGSSRTPVGIGRSNFSSCGLHMPLTYGVRHFGFCHRSSIINDKWGWEMAPMCISVKKFKWCQKELWCAWWGMLGIIHALEVWRHYLERAKHEIDIWTDHQNIKYFMSAKKLNYWQVHWVLFLSQFNFHLMHKAGTSMKKADMLSRQPDHTRGVENDNGNITLLKPEYFEFVPCTKGTY